MCKRSFVGALFVFFLSHALFGQQQQLDSLRRVLKETRDLRTLVDIHFEIAFIVYDQDIKMGFEESLLAYKLSREANYLKGEKKALSLIGFKYFLDGDHPMAMNYFRQSEAIDDKVDPVSAGYNWTLMGNLYRVKTAYDSADMYYAKATAILKAANDKVYLSYAYKCIGVLRQLQYRLDDASRFYTRSLQLREEVNNKRGLIDSNIMLGSLEMSRSNYIKANEYFDIACDLIDKGFYDNVALKVSCYLNDGMVHQKLGDFEWAQTQLFKALNLLKDQNFAYLYARTSAEIGELYTERSQFDLALTYYFEALRNFEQLRSKKEMGDVLSGIAWVYKSQLNFSLALDFLARSEKVRESIKDSHGLSNCYNVRGLILFQKKQYAEALGELNRALEIRRKLNYKEGVADVIFNMALVYEEQGDFKKALDYQKESMEMEKAFGSDLGMGTSYNSIGELLIRIGEYSEAEHYLKQGFESASRTKSKLLLKTNYQFFSELFEKKKDFVKSLHYRKLYDEIKDSIYVTVNSTKIAEMQALYQVEQKNQEIALQNAKLSLQEDELARKNIIITSITSGIILTTLLAFITYRYSRNIRKANREITEQKEEIQAQSEELIEANETIGRININLESKVAERTLEVKQAYKELDTFFYRSSHDFRRPLTTFLGLAEVAKITVKDTNALELFDKVRETAMNLDRMLIKLQSISDLGAQQLVYKELFIEELIHQVIHSFRDLIAMKHIRASVHVEPNIVFSSYPAMVKIIIENLIENAIDFCGVDDPFIGISAWIRQGELVIKVKDNGQGIREEYFSRIFDMYFRASQHSKGNGLGLYIVKKSVEKLSGRIDFTSVEARGSSFEVILPSSQTMHVV